ncbi:hypothetical protein VTK73DRAFT_7100 [Phialemonium thermophilum]|uniref:Fe2OG dioxygenase domain-containing protein n=1 Tax=Phialemonium thermophilum TaxID=223376 RepID=A0ABR3XTP7_9PEZI
MWSAPLPLELILLPTAMMDAYVTRRKRKFEPDKGQVDGEDDSTEVKLAMLASLHPHLDQDALLDILLAHDGSVAASSASLKVISPSKKPSGSVGSQASLRHFSNPVIAEDSCSSSKKIRSRLLSRRGATLHLYDPADIAEHTPCTVIHNFLPAEDANRLLEELLEESKSFHKVTFKLFDNVVSSPHTSGFYVGSHEELKTQKYDYVYNGSKLLDVRKITPQLSAVKDRVEEAVNREIQERIRTCYPGGKKLKHQSPRRWKPNAAFVNCYAGPQEHVGWHSDQMTYLGPRAVIGSLSLGVAREFRVRRVVPKESDSTKEATEAGKGRPQRHDQENEADSEGQIAIHLPHNSLLVMHAEMQEEWKHSVAPAQVIDPHPIAGNKRINITYRDYRPEFHPKYTPKCKCGVATVLRVVQKKKENWGRYFWMCYAGNVPGQEGCSFFQWARFDDDGNPIWNHGSLPRSETGPGVSHQSAT